MSALAFALLHFSVDFFPIAFIFGLLIGIVYVSTGSLFAVIAIHFLCHAFGFFAEAMVAFSLDPSSLLMQIFVTVCVLLASFGIPFVKDTMFALFSDDDEMSVPSSRIWGIPMIIFIVISVWAQFVF